MRFKHVPHSRIPLQKVGAGDADLMNDNIRTLRILDEILVRSHVSGNHHRVRSVINPKAKAFFRLACLALKAVTRTPFCS